ncbi:MAG: hypothetical protein P8X79_09130 [Reinekea sp.]
MLQLEMYLPNVSSTSDLTKALGSLKRFCKDQHNIAMTAEPFRESDHGQVSLVVLGTERASVERESEHLLTWVETNVTGQTLKLSIQWKFQ